MIISEISSCVVIAWGTMRTKRVTRIDGSSKHATEDSGRMDKPNVNRTQISRFHVRLAWGRNRFRDNSIPREENSQDGEGHCLGGKTQFEHSGCETCGESARGRQSLAKVESSTIVESAIRPQIRLGLSSAIRFLRGRSGGKVNFNDSDLMLESANRSFPFLVLDYR